MVLVAQVVGIAVVLLANIVVYLLNEHSILKRFWAKRRTTFFTTNRSSAVSVHARPATYFAWDVHDANHLVSCSFAAGKRGTCVVLVYRTFAAVYFAATTLVVRFVDEGLDPYFLPYFTNWTLILLGTYGTLGVALCVRQLQRDATMIAAPRAYGRLDRAFAALLCTCASCTLFLSVFFWASTPDIDYIAGNVLRHGANIALMWGDYAISRAPVAGYWFQFSMVYTSVYAAFMWIYATAGNGQWQYPSLDWRKDSAAVIYVFLPIAVYIGFILTYLVAGMREFFCQRKCFCTCCAPCCGCASRDACREGDVEMGTVNRPHGVTPQPQKQLKGCATSEATSDMLGGRGHETTPTHDLN